MVVNPSCTSVLLHCKGFQGVFVARRGKARLRCGTACLAHLKSLFQVTHDSPTCSCNNVSMAVGRCAVHRCAGSPNLALGQPSLRRCHFASLSLCFFSLSSNLAAIHPLSSFL
uniref:Predicted protein n=1 Tax=Hordeum vulgare subsp. vulgare TaxID=112509 RepID=F2EJI0_HORVV|nr:predicted protein [Hordeum vulgare subsp. vulgare]